MILQIKKLTDTAIIPEHGSKEAAGYDLFCDSEVEIEIQSHQTVMIHTGLSVAVPQGYFGGVFARSGLSSKEGLRPANCTGVIDSDYRGEVMVALHNDSEIARTVTPKQKVAQLVILPYLSVEFEEVMQLSDTSRGEGGFGSTGKH